MESEICPERLQTQTDRGIPIYMTDKRNVEDYRISHLSPFHRFRFQVPDSSTLPSESKARQLV
jgi:hypothetical protein